MKRILFLLSVFAVCVLANAQEHKNPEDDHVLVTLNDGTVVEGYIQTYWVDGKLFKRMNTSFKMSPAGRKGCRYIQC